MHPLLANRNKLGLYLIVWLILGGLIMALSVFSDQFRWGFAFAFALPITILFAFISLSAYYVCRSFPIQNGKTIQLLTVFGFVSVLSSIMWVALANVWFWFLGQAMGQNSFSEISSNLTMILFGLGIVLYIASASIHYLMIEFEKSIQSERREFNLKLLAQEAEFKTLRAQIDPHFLFNSLNSISALTTADPAGARRMTILLAEFLRKSLKLSAHKRITLNEELELGSNFLNIEKVRFSERLQVTFDTDPNGMQCLVPPLILQPLIENAIKHGISNLPDGGRITVQTKRLGSRVKISVENPVDTEPAVKTGTNIGLDNIQKRLKTLYADEARMDVIKDAQRFKVEIFIPAEEKTDGI